MLNTGIFLIVIAFILVVIRAFRIGDPAGSGPIRMSVPRQGFGLFHEGQIAYFFAFCLFALGMVLINT